MLFLRVDQTWTHHARSGTTRAASCLRDAISLSGHSGTHHLKVHLARKEMVGESLLKVLYEGSGFEHIPQATAQALYLTVGELRDLPSFDRARVLGSALGSMRGQFNDQSDSLERTHNARQFMETLNMWAAVRQGLGVKVADSFMLYRELWTQQVFETFAPEFFKGEPYPRTEEEDAVVCDFLVQQHLGGALTPESQSVSDA